MPYYNKKEKSGFVKIADAVIPTGGDSVGELIRKTVFLLSIVCIIVFIVMIAMNLQEKPDSTKGQASGVAGSGIFGRIPLEAIVVGESEPVSATPLEIFPEYIQYYEHNNDMIGWVYLPNTDLNYPVYQSDDNDYYLERNANHQRTELSAIFADWRVPVYPEKRSDKCDGCGRYKEYQTKRPNNTVIYGHNFSRGSAIGTIFAKVTHYNPRQHGDGFYKSHPVIEFDTLYERGVYKIFAASYFNTLGKREEVYEYYKVSCFENRYAFYDFIGNIMDRSEIVTDVDLEYGDEIITLSTCAVPLSGGLNDEIRFVLFARRVRSDESPEVDTDRYYRNPSVRYFEQWYRERGGSWQGRGWDTSKVKGFDEFIAQNPNSALAQHPTYSG